MAPRISYRRTRPADLAYGDHAAELRRGGTYQVLLDGEPTAYYVASDGYCRAWEPQGWEVLDAHLHRVRGSYMTRREAGEVAARLASK